MKCCLMTVCVVALAVSAAWAQQKKSAPPPPKTADDGPSLEVTMKFIQGKLNGVGPIGFSLLLQRADGTTQACAFQSHHTVLSVDIKQCTITYRTESSGAISFGKDGVSCADPSSSLSSYDNTVSLAEVQDISVGPVEQNFVHPLDGTPVPATADPPTFYLRLNRPYKPHRGRVQFTVQNATLADRVAKAMTHAVELCAGGSQPEPF
jgi:hypothetical protein